MLHASCVSGAFAIFVAAQVYPVLGQPMLWKCLIVKGTAGEELQVGVLEEEELLQLDVQQLEYRSAPR